MLSLSSWLAEAENLLAQARGLGLDAAMDRAVAATADALRINKQLLVCGNGGLASDAQHIVGEMVGRFLKERRALKAICLRSNPAVLTAWSNDYSFDIAFSRQVEAYAERGGAEAAKAHGMATIGLTGEGGGKMAALCGHLFAVPSQSTPAIQQVHLCLYHYFYAATEAAVA